MESNIIVELNLIQLIHYADYFVMTISDLLKSFPQNTAVYSATGYNIVSLWNGYPCFQTQELEGGPGNYENLYKIAKEGVRAHTSS